MNSLRSPGGIHVYKQQTCSSAIPAARIHFTVMVPLKTSTTMLPLVSQNVARPEVPTPSHSTTDCSLHRTGTSPRPIHFAKFSTQYSSLSRCLLLTRCQTFTPVSRPDCNQFTFSGSKKGPLIDPAVNHRFFDCCATSIDPNPTGSKFVIQE